MKNHISKTEHDYVVVFRVEFLKEMDASKVKFPPPKNADVWRFGPENVSLNESGFPIYQSRVWGGMAIYKDYAAARDATLNPKSALSFIESSDEYWSALLLPITHKGDVNWRGHIENSSAIKVADQDPGGQLAVITSAGFISQDNDQHERIARFTSSAEQVRKDFQGSRNNLRSSIFYTMHDLFDGITFTLWQSDQDMLNAVYGKGFHAELITTHQQTPMADRISNTRARVLLSTGTWNGNDPLDKSN